MEANEFAKKFRHNRVNEHSGTSHQYKIGYKLYKFSSKDICLYERQCTVPLNTWLKGGERDR